MAAASGHNQVESVDGDTSCIHITNLPPNVSTHELARIFGVPIQFIVINTVKNEAWIKNCFPWARAVNLASDHDGEYVNNKPLKCEAMPDRIHISELCPFDRINECRYGDQCSKKHVKCQNTTNCFKNDCFLGHKQYGALNHDPWPARFGQTVKYRIKISGLPRNVTIESLQTKLKKPKQGRYIILQSLTSTTTFNGVTAYLRNQTSEKMARKLVQQWHGKEYSNGFPIRCQLEIDQSDIDNQVNDWKKAHIVDDDDDDCDGDDDHMNLSQDTACNAQPLSDESGHSVLEKPTKIMFEVFEDSRKQGVWERIRCLNTTETGQGEVYLVQKTSGDGIVTEAALKIYKRSDKQNKRMRSYREMIALRTMATRGMTMTTHVTSLIETNIPDNLHEAVNNKDTLQIIVSLARGCSLTEYKEQYTSKEIGLREAITFCLKLLHIVKSFHACGVVHRDLKPDNIHIDLQKNQSIEQGHITILDFGLAYIKESAIADDAEFDELEPQQSINDYATDFGDTLGNRWYRVPQLLSQKTSGLTEIQKNQLKQQRRSPSIDASSICAFLYWFLTNEIPGEYYVKKEVPPHRKLMQNKNGYWDNVIQKAIKASGSQCDRSRLERYLMDIFDRGFADATHQWAIEQLLQHINIMYSWLHGGIVPSEESLHLAISTSSTKLSYMNDSFQSAARLFEAAKSHFITNSCFESRAFYHWNAEGTFHWIDEIATDQRTSVDLLYYYDHTRTFGTIPIYSLAKINEENNIMNLFVGSIINDVDLRLPVYTLPLNQSTYEQHEGQVKKIFVEELRTLIDLFRQKANPLN